MSTSRRPADHSRVYKIVDAEQWATLQTGRPWQGAPVDIADGFVHFSASDQVQGTLEKHFAGRTGLRVLEVPTDQLDPARLRWEVSRNGDLFPHLYGPLRVAWVAEVHEVMVDTSGAFAPLALTR